MVLNVYHFWMGFKPIFEYNNNLFRITSWTDIMLTKEKQWTVKTLVREAVIANPPRRPRKRYPTAHLLYRSGLQIQKDIYIRLYTVNLSTKPRA